MPNRYRQLDSAAILATLEQLRARIAERFPESGLSQVAAELAELGRDSQAVAEYLRRPLWPVRLLGGAIITLMLLVVVLVAVKVRLPAGFGSMGDLLQASESAIQELVFIGAAAWFMITLEERIKRRRALRSLHRLRSVAHVVDMHQLTKDPERLLLPQPDTASSPRRAMSPAELGRYLDYCSELLSLTAKIAALHVQHFSDSVALGAVTEIEAMTAGLSNKIWQKITLLERAAS